MGKTKDESGVFGVTKKGKIQLGTKYLPVSPAVIIDKRLSGNDLRVWLVLAGFWNTKTGLCFPSIETIARLSGLSEKTVKRIRKKLRRLRFILRWDYDYHHEGSKHEHCKYKLNTMYLITDEDMQFWRDAHKKKRESSKPKNKNRWVRP